MYQSLFTGLIYGGDIPLTTAREIAEQTATELRNFLTWPGVEVIAESVEVWEGDEDFYDVILSVTIPDKLDSFVVENVIETEFNPGPNYSDLLAICTPWSRLVQV